MILKIIVILLAYIFGSLPNGYLVAKRFGQIDIRRHGSGNIGARNIGRVLGKRMSLLVFSLDFAKGFIPLYLSRIFLPFHSSNDIVCPTLPLWIGLFTVIGHNWSIFLRFHGGKGVSTSMGVMCGLLLFFSTNTNSYSALILTGGLLSLIAIRHKENINRYFEKPIRN